MYIMCLYFCCNIFYSFIDSLISYCVILNNSNIKFSNLLRVYVFNALNNNSNA